MKRTIIVLGTIAHLIGQEAPSEPPVVSDKTLIAYKDAVIALNAANKEYDDFPANVKKALEEIQKHQQQAVQAGQAALNQAQADCGEKHQLDADAFSRTGTFVCVPKTPESK